MMISPNQLKHLSTNISENATIFLTNLLCILKRVVYAGVVIVCGIKFDKVRYGKLQ
jgi:hypothetical protein